METLLYRRIVHRMDMEEMIHLKLPKWMVKQLIGKVKHDAKTNEGRTDSEYITKVLEHHLECEPEVVAYLYESRYNSSLHGQEFKERVSMYNPENVKGVEVRNLKELVVK